jgi:hypothetical protein
VSIHGRKCAPHHMQRYWASARRVCRCPVVTERPQLPARHRPSTRQRRQRPPHARYLRRNVSFRLRPEREVVRRGQRGGRIAIAGALCKATFLAEVGGQQHVLGAAGAGPASYSRSCSDSRSRCAQASSCTRSPTPGRMMPQACADHAPRAASAKVESSSSACRNRSRPSLMRPLPEERLAAGTTSAPRPRRRPPAAAHSARCPDPPPPGRHRRPASRPAGRACPHPGSPATRPGKRGTVSPPPYSTPAAAPRSAAASTLPTPWRPAARK